MRAILRAESGRLWISTGDEAPLELPELTGPTDGRGKPRDPVEEPTDEISRPVLLRLAPALPPAAPARDSLPPLREAPPEPAPAPTRSATDDRSTNRFESWDWDEADPYSTGEYPVVPPPSEERSQPSLSIVRSPPPSTDADYAAVRAEPLPAPPRPSAERPEVAWAPRALRAQADPPPWVDPWREDTRIVIDPTLRPGPSPIAVALLDAAAWAAGFVVTFGAGLITTGSAGLVVFAALL